MKIGDKLPHKTIIRMVSDVDLSYFGDVLQHPQVLPIQGPYAIKLLAHVIRSFNNDRDFPLHTTELNDLARSLKRNYFRFFDDFKQFATCDIPSSSETDLRPQELLIHEIAKLYALSLANGTDHTAEITCFVKQLASVCVPSTENNQPLQDAYTTEIGQYLKKVFCPIADTDINQFVKACPTASPLPIEHILIKAERGEADVFPTERAARAAYDRAVAVGYALRHVLMKINKQDIVSSNTSTLIQALTVAVTLLSAVGLSYITSNYMWRLSANFRDEHEFYCDQWGAANTLYDADVNHKEDDTDHQNTISHGKGVEAFLAPALHMLGCSQVAAAGPRAWPAVFPKVEETVDYKDYFLDGPVDDPLAKKCHDNSSYCTILFDRKLFFRYNFQLCSHTDEVSNFMNACASRPDLTVPPTIKEGENSCEDIISVELSTSDKSCDIFERAKGHRGLSIFLSPKIVTTPEKTYLGLPFIRRCKGISRTAMLHCMVYPYDGVAVAAKFRKSLEDGNAAEKALARRAAATVALVATDPATQKVAAEATKASLAADHEAAESFYDAYIALETVRKEARDAQRAFDEALDLLAIDITQDERVLFKNLGVEAAKMALKKAVVELYVIHVYPAVTETDLNGETNNVTAVLSIETATDAFKAAKAKLKTAKLELAECKKR